MTIDDDSRKFLLVVAVESVVSRLPCLPVFASDELKQFWNVLEVKEVLNKNNVIGCSLFSTLSLKVYL